jgi:hypothetical protein
MMPGLYVFAAVGIVAGALGYAGGWQTQGWRLGEQITQIKAAQREAVNEAVREARAQESARFKGVQDAQAAAQTRAQVARRDADIARTELDRLRNDIRSARGGVPGESPGACTVRADASGELLAQCAGAYQGLAEVADRLNADRLMLIEAWPK